MKIVLSKIFSRERPFFYFAMWDESDRIGFKKFADHDVQNNLFLREGSNNKVSVWYDSAEFQTTKDKMAAAVKTRSEVLNDIMACLDVEWTYLVPLLTKQKELETIEDLESYYSHLTAWWSAMDIVYHIPGIDSIDEHIRKSTLAHRAAVEKYADVMNSIYLDFWREKFPQFWDVAYVLLPREAAALARGEVSEAELGRIRERLQGFGMFNGTLYSLPELEIALKERGVELEREALDSDVREIRGSPAYRGVVRGKVRLLQFREQIPSLIEGEILVTEMTDPDFVPAMKRAAAIVTDEGGVMCHAAIVSRELKKPCVVGTKFATQVFKDGDMIEVDADAGTVRKL